MGRMSSDGEALRRRRHRCRLLRMSSPGSESGCRSDPGLHPNDRVSERGKERANGMQSLTARRLSVSLALSPGGPLWPRLSRVQCSLTLNCRAEKKKADWLTG